MQWQADPCKELKRAIALHVRICRVKDRAAPLLQDDSGQRVIFILSLPCLPSAIHIRGRWNRGSSLIKDMPMDMNCSGRF